MSVEIRDAALGYAGAGWRVLPVSAKEKRPLVKGGVHSATTDRDQIIDWADRWEAIATPTGGGLLVIDIDPRSGGFRKPWMPKTREVSTQSGGIHLHYRIDEDIKSRAGLFGPGIDSKCKGGYVLLPPSPGYEWVDQCEPTTIWSVLLERWIDKQSFPQGSRGGMTRKAPSEWRRGMIHDQVLAWAAYFASMEIDELAVEDNVWAIIRQAQEAGVRIDNAGGHVDQAIRWVLERERNKPAEAPDLG